MRDIPPQQCAKCGKDSGTKILCEECFAGVTKNQIPHYDRTFQLTVIEMFSNSCVDCGKFAEAESGELCADHLETKGSDPLSRYDLANAVCRCADCHNQRHNASIARVPSHRKLPRQTEEKQKRHTKMPVCKKCRVVWALPEKSLCWKCA